MKIITKQKIKIVVSYSFCLSSSCLTFLASFMVSNEMYTRKRIEKILIVRLPKIRLESTLLDAPHKLECPEKGLSNVTPS